MKIPQETGLEARLSNVFLEKISYLERELMDMENKNCRRGDELKKINKTFAIFWNNRVLLQKMDVV